jgi:SAM-dependent methyltransferase
MANPDLEFKAHIEECPNCSRRSFRHFGGRTHFDWRIEYKICNNCGLIIQDPTMDSETADHFYKTQYRELYNGSAMPTEKEKEIQKRRAENQVLFLKTYLVKRNYTSDGSYLDIGCSTGENLLQVRKYFPAMKLAGIEPGDGYRRYCQQNGFEVFENDAEVLAKGDKYDIINLSHVLEHIPNPSGYLSYLKSSLLKPRGVLLLEVPNTIGGHGAFEIAHPICFIEKTLRDTLMLANFKDVSIVKHGVTKEEYELPEMYLLAASTSSDLENKFQVKSINPWIIKYRRRRGYQSESKFRSLKVILKEIIANKKK